MKILLLNDNPVVTKLVTLSAQKTDDTVTTTHSVAEAPEGSYDLLVIDDAQYSEERYAELKKKIKFKKSLFICSRENEKMGHFSATIKKPFLPTDLVELFTNLKNNLDVVEEDEAGEELFDGLDLEGLDNLDDIEDMDDDLMLDDEAIGENVLDNEEAQKVKALLDETEDEIGDEDFNLDYDLSLDLEDEADVLIGKEDDLSEDADLKEMSFDEDIANIDLDDAVDLDLAELGLEEDVLAEEEALPEDKLSEENLQMQDDEKEELSDVLDDGLLDEALNDSLDENLDDGEAEQEDALDAEGSLSEDIIPEVLDVDDEVTEDAPLDDEINLDEDDFAEDDATEEEEALPEDVIENEAPEDAFSDTSNNEIDSFASLNSRDLKVALGEADASDEEQNANEEVIEASNEESDAIEDGAVVEENGEIEQTKESENKGLASLKSLLSALENENVAAAMQGAKITINISFED